MSDPFADCLAIIDKIDRDLDECSAMARGMSLSLDGILRDLSGMVFWAWAGAGIIVLATVIIVTA